MKTKLLVTVSALILSGSMAFAQASEPAPTPVEAQITAFEPSSQALEIAKAALPVIERGVDAAERLTSKD